MRVLLIAVTLLAGCATGYNPTNVPSVQDQVRNANPNLNCPGAVVCDVEGGGIVGKTYGNCRCAR